MKKPSIAVRSSVRAGSRYSYQETDPFFRVGYQQDDSELLRRLNLPR